MNMHRIVSAGVLAACLVGAPLMASANTELPDATIEFSGGSVAAGIGYSWGTAVLTYEGRSYPVKVRGLSVNSYGVESIRASGDVYHLSNLAAFNGNYTAASAGVTVGGGAAGSALENQNGVVIMMRAHTLGLELNFSIDGVAMNMK